MTRNYRFSDGSWASISSPDPEHQPGHTCPVCNILFKNEYLDAHIRTHTDGITERNEP